MNDEGMSDILRKIEHMEYGYGEISFKKHNGFISQVSVPTAKSLRISGWSQYMAYWIEKAKAYQTAASNGNTDTHKISLVVEIDSKGEVSRIIENDYMTTHFKTPA